MRRRLQPTRLAVAGICVVVAAVLVAAVVVALGHRHAPGSPGRADHPVAGSPARSGRLATGPLVPSVGALFGAWVEPTGGFTVGDQEAGIAEFEQQLGRTLAIDQLYVRWSAPMPLAIARWDLRRGSIPMISWGGAPTHLIASGRYDAQIRARALQLQALHGPVMLRWFAEMDGSFNRGDAGSPGSFIAAWRHIHNIFTSLGVTNVYWVWSATAANFQTGHAQKFYPGDSFVNWVGADGYNWAPQIRGARWKSFADIFSSFYRWGISSGKPLLIGEYGVLENAPGQKAMWFRQAAMELRTQFPAIRAVIYFDSDHDNFDWRVTTSSSAFVAFRAFANDPYFQARPAA